MKNSFWLCWFTVCCLLVGGKGAKGAQWQSVVPISERIVALYVVDGKSYPETLGHGDDGHVEVVPLNVVKAVRSATYKVTSPDDARYRTARQPIRVGRKSKGREFVNAKGKYPYLFEHWLYLVLPQPMQRGKTYRISSSLAPKVFVLCFDERRARSETIHVNQIGYAPEAPQKFGYLSAWLGDMGQLKGEEWAQKSFHLVNVKTGKSVFSGRPTLRRRLTDGPEGGQPDETAPYAATDTWQCDFSAFRTPGQYVLSVDGIGCSFPFRIEADVYRQAFLTTLRGLYHQRCGIALDAKHTRWTRATCHLPATAKYWQVTQRNMDKSFSDGHQNKEGITKTGEQRNIWGGWHDAGDWDHEAWHPEVSNMLLMVYEMAPEKFRDGESNIPESGNGVPDIVDEARWGIDFYARLQRPSGGVSAGTFADWWPRRGETSTTDSMNYYVYAEEPLATYKFASSASRLAWCLRLAGKPEQSTSYVAGARRAWEWAQNNTRTDDEKKVRDERLHAAAALFKVTGEAKYLAAFKQDLLIDKPDTLLSVWDSHDQRWGVWTYATTQRPGMDADLKARLVQATLHYAQVEFVETAAKRAGRYGYNWWKPMWFGAATTPETMPLIMAHALSRDPKYLGTQYTTCDYILGGNPLNMTWVTGLGARSPQNISHIESWYDSIPKPVPGILILGPYKYSGQVPENSGPWEVRWVHGSTYPDARQWPAHELWFENRLTPTMSEFTVGSIARGAAAFGYLSAGKSSR